MGKEKSFRLNRSKEYVTPRWLSGKDPRATAIKGFWLDALAFALVAAIFLTPLLAAVVFFGIFTFGVGFLLAVALVYLAFYFPFNMIKYAEIEFKKSGECNGLRKICLVVLRFNIAFGWLALCAPVVALLIAAYNEIS